MGYWDCFRRMITIPAGIVSAHSNEGVRARVVLLIRVMPPHQENVIHASAAC